MTAENSRFYEIIPTEIYRQGGGALTYSSTVPLQPGQLVLIPLGTKTVIGLVLKKVPRVNFPTKSIIRELLPTPIPAHLLKSALWLADYYLSPLPATANLIIPAGLTARGALTPYLNPLEQQKQLLPGKSAKAPAKIPSEAPQKPTTAFSGQTLKLPLIPLNNAQKTALASLQEAPGPTRLLRGVTGSGKTNIYLKLAAEALKRQTSAILLVPEIALTSQLIRIFEQTFGARAVLIHSQQTLTERRTTWLKLLHSQEPLIVIGPRSALLSPLHNLGLIIIDEAHEGAYYQENTPRYSALRLASFMASTLKIPCLLGTATPSIVDYYLARQHHSLIELSTKAKTTAKPPETKVVDLRDKANFCRNRYFSDALLAEITQNLQNHHQTLIFHNRRGSAPLTLCENCGWQALCPNCYLPMTLHADGYLLTCHICGHEAKVPPNCPVCGHPEVIHKGFGTKLLESELTRLFPQAKIARFDGDNKRGQSLAELYQKVKTGQIDLLIGTQTLARGLDLPYLATVGIIQADAGLALPDFAAEERNFELLTQVIGRVGRGHLDRANVVVQTFQPDHPCIQAALTADFPAFAQYLLRQRQKQALPPFSYLAKLSVTYKTEKTALTKIRQIYATLSTQPELQVSPPAPAFHERTARGYTWQLILKSSSRAALRAALLPYHEKYSVVLDPPTLL